MESVTKDGQYRTGIEKPLWNEELIGYRGIINEEKD